MFKKVKIESPEVQIAGANLQVDAQKSQFTQMIYEVQSAIGTREGAIMELEKELASLLAQVEAKSKAIDEAEAQNQADEAYVERLQSFIG
jgi:peptidoglycan hydrolase CwlO-like protein